MPVKIIRRSATPTSASVGVSHVTIKRVPAIKPGLTAEVEDNPRGWAVGGGIVLRKHDLSFEAGHTKFLLHRVKDKVWYRLRNFEEDLNLVSLTSQVKFDFSCKVDATLYRNYVVAVFPSEVITEPTAEMLVFVNRRLPHILQTSATAEAA